MLRNLLENALVHGAADQPVQVTVTQDRRVLIANDCAAIDPALLATLEKPFVRGQTEAEGSGLGLGIARQISRLFHADMSLLSPVPGRTRGVLVTLAFPPQG
jgi:two-component system OmpR family sensor kinase